MQIDELLVTDVYGSDPLARVLVGRWRVRPLVFALFFFFGGLVYLTLLSAVFGYMLPHVDIFRASFEDTFNQINFLLIFPVVAYYYLRQSQSIVRVYSAVVGSVHFVGNKGILSVTQIQALHTKPRWWIPGVLLGVLGVLLGTYDNIGKLGSYWYAANWLMILVMQSARGIVLYMLITIVVRHLTACVGLNRIFLQAKFPLPIKSAGHNAGFQAITNYALGFAGIAAVVGLNLGLQPVLSSPPMPEYVIFVALYFALVPIGFFLPLWQAHRKMVEIKQCVLGDLTRRLQLEFENLLENLTGNGHPACSEREKVLGRLQAIREAIDLTEESSNWPFRADAIYKLVATAVLPFVFTIFDLVFMVLDLIREVIAR